jgi:hypothetical protein
MRVRLDEARQGALARVWLDRGERVCDHRADARLRQKAATTMRQHDRARVGKYLMLFCLRILNKSRCRADRRIMANL